jgi:hypothetical protein
MIETANPSGVIGVVLGAARFKKWPAGDDERLAGAFAASKADVLRLLWRFADDVLDRFDSSQGPGELCEEISNFLEERPQATDLVVYYVGHGAFLNDQSYFLYLRETATDHEHTTGLRASDLATTLKNGFRNRRTFVLLDCCFGGAMYDLLQGPVQDLLDQQVAMGVALLNAASKDKVALVPLNARRTMFSDCLCEVLQQGIPGAPPKLSLRTLRRAIVDRIAKKYPTSMHAWPQVGTPRSFAWDIADFELFPNAAWKAPDEKVREEQEQRAAAEKKAREEEELRAAAEKRAREEEELRAREAAAAKKAREEQEQRAAAEKEARDELERLEAARKDLDEQTQRAREAVAASTAPQKPRDSAAPTPPRAGAVLGLAPRPILDEEATPPPRLNDPPPLAAPLGESGGGRPGELAVSHPWRVGTGFLSNRMPTGPVILLGVLSCVIGASLWRACTDLKKAEDLETAPSARPRAASVPEGSSTDTP